MDYRERMEGKAGVLLQIADQYLAGQIPQDEAAALIGNEMSNIRPGQMEALKVKLGDRLTKARSQAESEKLFELFRNHLSPPYHKLAEGHPLKIYFDENSRLRSLLVQIDELEYSESAAEAWIDLYESLQEYNIHFKRQEMNFYPLLVQAGLQQQIDRAQELNRAIRSAVTTNLELLITLDHVGFLFRQRDLSRLYMDYLDLEERLLYMKALNNLTVQDFTELRIKDDEVGYTGIKTPPVFCLKESPVLDPKVSLPAAAETTLNAEQILSAVLKARESGLICFDLTGEVISVQGGMIDPSDLDLSTEAKTSLLAGREKSIEAVTAAGNGSWRLIISLIRDDHGKPQGFLKIKEKISKSMDGEQNIAELFAQYPEFKDDFFDLDEDLKALKGSYGMELLKDSTIEMIAKSLRIDAAELKEKIDQLLQTY